MPIRPRGSSFQVDVVLNGQRKQVSCKTMEEALAIEKKVQAELRDAPNPKGAPITLKDALDATFKRFWEGTKSEVENKKKINSILKDWGESRYLNSIDTRSLDTWMDALKARGNTNATINRKMSCLSMSFKWAIGRDHVVAKPKMERLKEATGRIRYISIEEEYGLLGHLVSLNRMDVHDAVVIMLDSGCRLGELLRMQAKDFTPACALQRGRVALWDTKNGKSRTQPLTARANATLVHLKKLGADRFFPYKPSWIRHVWDEVKGKLGLTADDQFVPHCLRHTYASRLAQRGVAIQVIQRLMGHDTIAVTMRYAHLSQGNLDSGVDCLESKETA